MSRNTGNRGLRAGDGASPNQAITRYEDIRFGIAATELEWRRPFAAGEVPE
jgi:hypothetical protein